MEISLHPGTYVVAVSGGVDSIVLLDLVQQLPGVRLVIAHYDHGIRTDSHMDREFVQQVAREYGLPFVFNEGRLGPDASEAEARQARYDFLHRVRKAANANAVITAHHEDDMLETAILNILRGTGRKGLSSLRSTDVIARPLLHMQKNDIINHAKSKGLSWREDPTNQDVKYMRNYVRHKILPNMSKEQRQELLEIIRKFHTLNDHIDGHLINHLHLHPALDRLDRHMFIMLSHEVAREVMAAWLRRHDIKQFDKKTLERLVVAAKTMKPGTYADISAKSVLRIDKRDITLVKR